MIWLSVHIFYEDSLDFLLKTGIEPFINKTRPFFSNWFFIRYMEGGQHIRLRLKIKEQEKSKITAAIKQYFDNFFESFPAEKQVNKLNSFPKNSIHFINYEPEIDRYGGQIGLHISEQLFQYSSEFVLKFIEADADYENKLLIAALMNFNLALIYFENQEERIRFFERVTSDWMAFNIQNLDLTKAEVISKIERIKSESILMLRPLLSEYIENMNSGIEDDFSNWRKQNLEIKEQLLTIKLTKSIPQLLESYIHLNNNRLGVSNFDEALVNCLLY